MTTLAVLQPGYLPWLGFFDLMRRADVFVHYDDVPFDKHGWRNRNRVKSPTGPRWLTAPVRHKGLAGQKILDVELDLTRPWQRKHVCTLAQLYAHAPHTADYLPQLARTLAAPRTRLVDLDLALSQLLADWLDIRTPAHRASALPIPGAIPGARSRRLVDLCRHFGARRYLTGDSARNYLDPDLFAAAGIQVVWQTYRHPTYPQQFGAFAPYLSVVDLLFNVGPAAAEVL